MNAVPAGDPFGALADPNRRDILRLLKTGEQHVQELADQMPISRPAVSRHLKLLKNAGLVSEHKTGTRNLYRLEQQGLETVQAYFVEMWGDAITRFTLLAENTAPQEPKQ